MESAQTGARDIRLSTGGVSPVPRFEPSEHTVVGFAIRVLAATMAELSARGVQRVRFPGFSHDASGAITAPGHARVAWIRDPDGNLLAIVQYGPDSTAADEHDLRHGGHHAPGQHDQYGRAQRGQ